MHFNSIPDPASLVPKIRRRVVADASTGCWNWQGAKVSGYGQVWCPMARITFLTHRVMVEALRGPIPQGLAVDHLCRNKSCCNPDHLEVVTQRENVLRGDAGEHRRIEARAITHCPQGHEYSAENTSIRARGWRKCKTCERLAARRRRQQKLPSTANLELALRRKPRQSDASMKHAVGMIDQMKGERE